MKGAAKCDKHCELQNSVNQQVLERILRFRDIPESMPASVSTLSHSHLAFGCCEFLRATTQGGEVGALSQMEHRLNSNGGSFQPEEELTKLLDFKIALAALEVPPGLAEETSDKLHFRNSC